MARMDVYFLLLLSFPGTTALVESQLNVVTTVQSRSERYTTNCGFLGWSGCTRYRAVYYKTHSCKSGYRSIDGVSCPYAICDGAINPAACNIDYVTSHIIYSNGMVQYSSGGTCTAPETCIQCREGFYSSLSRCRMCSAIANCDLESCTSPSNQKCSRCEGVVMDLPGRRAYVVSSDKKSCIQACSWRADSTRCFPGRCQNEYASSCSCSNGFSGIHCQTIDLYPAIVYNSIRIIGLGGDIVDAPVDPNAGSPQDYSFSNIGDVKNIQFKFTSNFRMSGVFPNAHRYIESYAVGITRASVRFQVNRNGSVTNEIERTCNGVSIESPHLSAFTCEGDVPSERLLPLQNGDLLQVRFETMNGGFVGVRNMETDVLRTHYYDGQTKSNVFFIKMDFHDPYHCSVMTEQTCSYAAMNVAKTSTVNPITVEWRGWEDNTGISYYKVTLLELHQNGSELRVKSQSSVKDIDVSEMSTSVSMPKAGVYSVVLSTYDKGGNYKNARRIFIFDSVSSITTNQTKSLVIASGAQETSHMWQWNVTAVSIHWKDRYSNVIHHSNGWLKEVRRSVDVDLAYDDNNRSRGVDAIPNVQGIVEYRTAYLVDHSGGSTITSVPPDTSFVTQNLRQDQIVTPSLVDGDTLRFWIRAYDIRQEFLEENVTVYIDSSAPVIANPWLIRNDRLNISVHSSENFTHMAFGWVAYDLHSGIDAVSWRLFDNITGTDVVLGNDMLTIQALPDCKDTKDPTECYCTPGNGCYEPKFMVKTGSNVLPGKHGSYYFLEVTVSNHAQLFVRLSLRVEIDTTPPNPGLVYDGRLGHPEVDNQDTLQLHSNWDGFTDQESGVKFYQYGFANHCLSAGDFSVMQGQVNKTGKVWETSKNTANWTAPAFGTYFVTVVAFNAALEMSETVCSDGVTVGIEGPKSGKRRKFSSKLILMCPQMQY